jgi:hypothetical protein
MDQETEDDGLRTSDRLVNLVADRIRCRLRPLGSRQSGIPRYGRQHRTENGLIRASRTVARDHRFGFGSQVST